MESTSKPYYFAKDPMGNVYGIGSDEKEAREYAAAWTGRVKVYESVTVTKELSPTPSSPPPR